MLTPLTHSMEAVQSLQSILGSEPRLGENLASRAFLTYCSEANTITWAVTNSSKDEPVTWLVHVEHEDTN